MGVSLIFAGHMPMNTQKEDIRPKIWQLVDSSAIGGIERHIEMLATGLRRAGFDSQVILYDDHGKNPWFDQLKAAKIPYSVLKGSTRALKAAIKLHKPDLIHTHGYKAGILGRAVARLTGTPVVSTFHSGERGEFPVSLYQYLDEKSAFLAPAIAVSKPIRSRLPAGSELMHNFVTMPLNAADVMNPKSRIGFVGRMSREKGPDYFCALAKALKDKPGFEKISWHAYGGGPMLKKLKQISGDYVSFHGVRTDMADIWPNLDLLVMPSRAEGMPLAALEALSHGIPVVASRLGGLPDLIDHGTTGFLYRAGETKRAAHYITEWAEMNIAEKTAMFTECRATIREKFTFETRLQKLLKIYRKSGFKIAA